MAIVRVCLKTSDLIALIERISGDDGYVSEDALTQGLRIQERYNIVDRTLFDIADETFQTFPRDGLWENSEQVKQPTVVKTEDISGLL